MTDLKYFLQGFGFKDTNDFKTSVFKLLAGNNGVEWSIISVTGGIVTYVTGLQPMVFVAFCALIFLEFYTGVKVSRKIKSEKFKSRKMGRMFMKLTVYIVLVSLLNAFRQQVDMPDIMGLEVNPFTWLYYAVFIGITFQMLISYLENLGRLGYSETKGLTGMLLRRLNKFFEMDGEKNNPEDHPQEEEQ